MTSLNFQWVQISEQGNDDTVAMGNALGGLCIGNGATMAAASVFHFKDFMKNKWDESTSLPQDNRRIQVFKNLQWVLQLPVT